MLKLFSRHHQKKSTLTGLSREYYIGNGVSVHGELTSENDIYLDGSFEGKISTEGLIEIDVNGKASGTCRARTIILRGRYEGDLIAKENITIGSSAQIEGTISARSIETQPGAELHARLNIGGE